MTNEGLECVAAVMVEESRKTLLLFCTALSVIRPDDESPPVVYPTVTVAIAPGASVAEAGARVQLSGASAQLQTAVKLNVRELVAVFCTLNVSTTAEAATRTLSVSGATKGVRSTKTPV